MIEIKTPKIFSLNSWDLFRNHVQLKCRKSSQSCYQYRTSHILSLLIHSQFPEKLIYKTNSEFFTTILPTTLLHVPEGFIIKDWNNNSRSNCFFVINWLYARSPNFILIMLPVHVCLFYKYLIPCVQLSNAMQRYYI